MDYHDIANHWRISIVVADSLVPIRRQDIWCDSFTLTFCEVWLPLSLPISSRVTSLELGQSYDDPRSTEATQKDMG